MKQMLLQRAQELLDQKTSEEIVVCFIEDCKKLNNPEINNLVEFYRLNINKGKDFEMVYNNVKKRMEELKKREAEMAKQVPPPQPTPPQQTKPSVPKT